MFKKARVAVLAVALLLGLIAGTPSAAAAAPSVKLPTYESLVNGDWYSLARTKLVGFSNDEGLRLIVKMDGGNLRMKAWDGSISNVQVPYGYRGNDGDEGSLMAWDAENAATAVAELEKILSSLEWTAEDIHSSQITVQIAPAGVMFNADNGHYYRAVDLDGMDMDCLWQAANEYASASEQKFHGLDGYLATVTSQAENDFIADYIGVDSWIGASDHVDFVNAVTEDLYADQAAVEGKFYWVTGPEAGTQITTENDAAIGSITGVYNNFNLEDGEPNNWDDNESFVEYYAGNHTWNDMLDSVCGALIEWGGIGTWEGDVVNTDKSAVVETLIGAATPACDAGKLVGRVRFAANVAYLNHANLARLRTLGGKAIRSGCTSITLEGYAALASSKYLPGMKERQALSLARAKYTRNYLAGFFKRHGAKIKIVVVNRGGNQAIGDNHTAAGRRANRRVDVRLGSPNR